MSDPTPLPLVESSGLGRREVLQRALGAMGDADAKARAAKFKPEFLDEHQHATLASLAERIVPGASKARVSQFIDSLLAVDSTQSQRGFLQALGAFEGHAIT